MQQVKLFILFGLVVSSTSILPAARSSESPVSKTTLLRTLSEMGKKGFEGCSCTTIYSSLDFKRTFISPNDEKKDLLQLKELVNLASTRADLELIIDR